VQILIAPFCSDRDITAVSGLDSLRRFEVFEARHMRKRDQRRAGSTIAISASIEANVGSLAMGHIAELVIIRDGKKASIITNLFDNSTLRG
jgi:hypothetical protein